MSEPREPEQKETTEQSTDETPLEQNNGPLSSATPPSADTRPEDERTGEGTGARAGEYN
jgi:hypothetical protein